MVKKVSLSEEAMKRVSEVDTASVIARYKTALAADRELECDAMELSDAVARMHLCEKLTFDAIGERFGHSTSWATYRYHLQLLAPEVQRLYSTALPPEERLSVDDARYVLQRPLHEHLEVARRLIAAGRESKRRFSSSHGRGRGRRVAG